MRKYELTGETVKNVYGVPLHRIRALMSFGDVSAGTLGGYLEREENLSHAGLSWVAENAQVYGNARVMGDAQVSGNAVVFGDAGIMGKAQVMENTTVCQNAQVCGRARIYGKARLYGSAKARDKVQVYDCAEAGGNALLSGKAQLFGCARVCGNALIRSSLDCTTVGGFGHIQRVTTFFRCRDGVVRVACGCFLGTLPEFRERVIQKYGDGIMGREYLAAADLMEMHFAVYTGKKEHTE